MQPEGTPRRSRLRIAAISPAASLAACFLFLAPSFPATPDSAVPTGLVLQRQRHLAQLGVDRWHATGQRGRGIKIAVLDSGFRGYRAQLGKALPEVVTTRSFRADHDLEARDSQHGILCGEVLHALAPEAELLFANWDPDRPEEFLDAARWARSEGARVMTCSLIMPSWSDGEGHGPLHEALAQVTGSGDQPGDLLFFASAGNTALRHWSGSFHADKTGWHEWDAGQTANLVTPWGDERISVEATWPAGAEYEICLRDAAGGQEIGKATGRTGAVVRFLPASGHSYELCLRLVGGRGNRFHVVVLGGGLRYARAEGSIPFPADGPEVLAVAAVDADGHRLPYSSCGPNSDGRKPDLAAVVPFASLWRPRPFSGTSAAAPQAAGLAALLWGRHPESTARQVRRALESAAVDLGPRGHDAETGYGSVFLPRP